MGRRRHRTLQMKMLMNPGLLEFCLRAIGVASKVSIVSGLAAQPKPEICIKAEDSDCKPILTIA
jgi:hypothetical protein